MIYKGMVQIDDSDDSIHDSHLARHRKGTIAAMATVRKSGTLSRTTNDGSSVQNVTGLGFRASMVYILASNDQDQATFSDGWGDGLTNVCTRSVLSVPVADLSNALNVQVVIGGVGGWTATILGNPDGFDVSWTKVGAGLNVTAKYLAIK